MKAEERKQLERNELAAKLSTAWQGMTSNSTAVTVVWGVVLLGLVALIGYRYYSRAGAETRSELWARLDRASDVDELEKIINEHKSSEAARIARFHLSRFELQDSLHRIGSPVSPEEREKAAVALEKVRDRYAELATESGVEPLLTQEAMMAVAKAEEVLAGVPTAADSTRMRGSLAKAVEAYDALAKKYPKTFLGDEAAKRATEVRDHRSQIEAFYITLSKAHGKPEPAPVPPPLPTPPSPILPGPELPKTPEAPKAEGPKPEAPKVPEAPKGEPKAPEANKPGGPQP
jgi:hypothetical protein